MRQPLALPIIPSRNKDPAPWKCDFSGCRPGHPP
eukprot:CCRYP_011953-RB/>CCRYP_011953-RB protein AED:0.47 eAED:0.47 QI:0/-1/0/1/-1/0/1/0/33